MLLGMMKPDIPKKRPTIVIGEEAERATTEQLAGVLTFPKTVLQFAAMKQGKEKRVVYRNAVSNADRGAAVIAYPA